MGSAAGTAVTPWQASLGLVEAGSLLAWCQSVAMGGAAAGGIQVVGAISLAIAGTIRISIIDISGIQGELMRFSPINKVIALDLPRAGNDQKAVSRPGCCTPRTPQLRAWKMAPCL